jgi:polyhydroxyalkanoate synthesis regulator phasin
MAQEAWRAYLELAIGATDATRKKATKTVKQLVGKGALSGEQLQTMAEDLLRTSSASREAMTNLVRYELEKALGRIGLATADEVNVLSAKVRDLEAKLREATAMPPGAIESHDGPPVGAEVVAKRTAAKKTLTKKAVAQKAVPQTAVAQKAVAKKAVAKKTVAKKAVKKAIAAPAFVEPPGAAPAGAEPLAPPAARKAVKRVAAVRKTAATAARKAAPRRPAGGAA